MVVATASFFFLKKVADLSNLVGLEVICVYVAESSQARTILKYNEINEIHK